MPARIANDVGHDDLGAFRAVARDSPRRNTHEAGTQIGRQKDDDAAMVRQAKQKAFMIFMELRRRLNIWLNRYPLTLI